IPNSSRRSSSGPSRTKIRRSQHGSSNSGRLRRRALPRESAQRLEELAIACPSRVRHPSLAAQLTATEERHMANPPKIDPKINPQAWQDYQDGLKLYRLFTKTDNEEARKRFDSAIRRQSEAFRRQPDRWQADFPRAYALLSATHRQDWILAWSGVGEDALRASQKAAEDKAEDAVRLASGPPPQPSLPQAYLQ